MENDNVGIDRYYNNTGQNVITITEDRLQLRAKEYEENLNLAKWGYSSIATTLSTLIAICTSNFKDMLYFSKETWEAFFCLVCLGGFFCTCRSIVTYFIRSRNKTFIHDSETFVLACRKNADKEQNDVHL